MSDFDKSDKFTYIIFPLRWQALNRSQNSPCKLIILLLLRSYTSNTKYISALFPGISSEIKMMQRRLSQMYLLNSGIGGIERGK